LRPIAGLRLAKARRVLSVLHEAIIELYRGKPRPLVAALRAPGASCAALLANLDEKRAYVADPSFSQLVSTAWSCDLAIEVPGDDGHPPGAILVEVQLEIDRRKALTWPMYVHLQRARLDGGPVCLVVITDSDRVARWAEATLREWFTSAMGWHVIGPSNAPHVDDRLVRREPELAVLSALLRANQVDVDEARLALQACSTLSPKPGKLLQAVLRSQLDPAILQTLDTNMLTWDLIIEDVMERGLATNVEARFRGRMIIRTLERRGLTVDDAARATILGCTDDDRVLSWMMRLGTVASVAELLADEEAQP
jgi:hypothetical protein